MSSSLRNFCQRLQFQESDFELPEEISKRILRSFAGRDDARFRVYMRSEFAAAIIAEGASFEVWETVVEDIEAFILRIDIKAADEDVSRYIKSSLARVSDGRSTVEEEASALSVGSIEFRFMRALTRYVAERVRTILHRDNRALSEAASFAAILVQISRHMVFERVVLESARRIEDMIAGLSSPEPYAGGFTNE